jgi:hypothetical protein
MKLLRLDQKLIEGIPMNPRRMANVFEHQAGAVAGVLRPSRQAGRRDHGAVADGRAVEIPVF